MLRDGAGAKRVIVVTGYTDMRWGIDSLAFMIQDSFRLNPLEKGTLFLFCGRRSDRIKGLFFEGLSEDSCYPHILSRNRIDFSRYSYSFP